MKSLMQQMLGPDWDRLSPALQAHHRLGRANEIGHMDIDYPRFMQPVLTLLRLFGALVNRRDRRVSTVVEKTFEVDRQHWRRIIRYADGKVIHFNSYWVLATPGEVIEFVNPILGLQMAPYVDGSKLKFRGVRFVLKLGPRLIPIPEWLALGHTTIVEEAVDEKHFAMDFRLRHPLLGEVFRYSGEFQTIAAEQAD